MPAAGHGRRGALAGVSHQTVSRVLNDHPNVRPQTRDSVLAAIARAGLPAERGGPHAGHPAHPHARRDQLRHHPVRARLHALRHRAGRRATATSCPSPACRPWTGARARRGGPVPRPGRRGDHRDRAAGPRRWPRSATSRAHVPLVAVGCGTQRAADLGRGGQRRRAPRWPPGTCSASGHRTVHHIAGPGSLAGRAGAGRRLAGGAGARPARRSRSCCAGDWSAALGLRDRPADRRRRQRHRGVLRERPRWRSACSGRWPSRAAGAGDVSVVGLRRHPGVGLLPAAADHGPPGLRRTGPARAGRAGRT